MYPYSSFHFYRLISLQSGASATPAEPAQVPQEESRDEGHTTHAPATRHHARSHGLRNEFEAGWQSELNAALK